MTEVVCVIKLNAINNEGGSNNNAMQKPKVYQESRRPSVATTSTGF